MRPACRQPRRIAGACTRPPPHHPSGDSSVHKDSSQAQLRPLADPDAPLSAFAMAIWLFTMCRFGCSRCADFRTGTPAALTRASSSKAMCLLSQRPAVGCQSRARTTDLSTAHKSTRPRVTAFTLRSFPSVVLEAPVVVVALITIAARGTDATLDLEVGLAQR